MYSLLEPCNNSDLVQPDLPIFFKCGQQDQSLTDQDVVDDGLELVFISIQWGFWILKKCQRRIHNHTKEN